VTPAEIAIRFDNATSATDCLRAVCIASPLPFAPES
jgi:hypothetical protein